MISRVPDHPALGLLSNPQGAQEEDSTPANTNNTFNSDASSSTIATSAPSQATQSTSGQSEPRAKGKKRKTPSSDQPESYEVEEILDHQQDSQARFKTHAKSRLELIRFDIRVTGHGRSNGKVMMKHSG
jgi:hypothetical protein